jgi:CRISPR-associated protein Csx17
MESLILTGCQVQPFCGYFKSIGLLRILNQQLDRKIRGYWREDGNFALDGIDRTQLLEFLTDRYKPTPLIQPWNNGTGFTKGLSPDIPTAERFDRHQRLAAICKSAAAFTGLNEKDKVDRPAKIAILNRLKQIVPSDLRAGVDTAWIVYPDLIKPNFLLANGGMSGNVDLGKLQIQNINLVFDEWGNAVAGARAQLTAALFGDIGTHINIAGTIAFLSPVHTGGISSNSDGKKTEAQSNPWDYLLALEGLLSLTPNLCRRYRNSSDPIVATIPFAVRPQAVGNGSLATGDKCMGEIWVPIWHRPSLWKTIEHIFDRHRLTIDRQPVQTSTQAQLAVANLGRGSEIAEFIRYAFLVRNGDAQFAIALDRYQTGRTPKISPAIEIDRWLGIIARTELPNTIITAISAVRHAQWHFANGEPLLNLLVAVGKLQNRIENSSMSDLRPPVLTRAWYDQIEASPVFRLALAKLAASNDVLCGLEDVNGYLNGTITDGEIDAVISGLKLVKLGNRFESIPKLLYPTPLSYSLCVLAFQRYLNVRVKNLLLNDRCLEATKIAIRLLGNDFNLKKIQPIWESTARSRAIGQSLDFRLSKSQLNYLTKLLTS